MVAWPGQSASSATSTPRRSTCPRSALLLATEPKEKVGGRVICSQEILKEFGRITNGNGTGVERKGSGYSQI